MATANPSATVAARVQFLDDRIGYIDFEIQHATRWRCLFAEMAEAKDRKASQWEEEKHRLERERDELFSTVKAS